MPDVVEKGLGVQSGGRGFKFHPPAGVTEVLHQILESSELPLPHLYKGANAEVGLAGLLSIS